MQHYEQVQLDELEDRIAEKERLEECRGETGATLRLILVLRDGPINTRRETDGQTGTRAITPLSDIVPTDTHIHVTLLKSGMVTLVAPELLAVPLRLLAPSHSPMERGGGGGGGGGFAKKYPFCSESPIGRSVGRLYLHRVREPGNGGGI